MHTFTDKYLLLIRLKVMQCIGYDDCIGRRNVQIIHILCNKMNIGVAAETVLGNCYFFFVIVISDQVPCWRSELKHITHKTISATDIQYSALLWQQIVKDLIVFLQSDFNPQIPFEHWSFVQIVIDQQLSEKTRLLPFILHFFILLSEISSQIFGSFGIVHAKKEIAWFYSRQIFDCDKTILQ